MSNPNDFHIGAGAVSIDNSDIGLTTQEGVVVVIDPDVHLHLSGKYGMTPVKATLLGHKITIQVFMGETTNANMANAIAGASGSGKVKFGGDAGSELVGHTLDIAPFDGTPAWHFRNVVPTGSVEVAYQVENERVYKAQFTAMVDVDMPEDENVAYVS
jgi:hypothetical protein